jgi:hypothetical protein
LASSYSQNNSQTILDLAKSFFPFSIDLLLADHHDRGVVEGCCHFVGFLQTKMAWKELG